MDNFGILSLAPAFVALILAFITREALFSITCGVVIGIAITGENLLFGFTGILQSALGNADFIWVASIEVFIGIMVAFFMKSGAIQTLTARLSGGKGVSGKAAQLTAWLLGVFIFFSDYFSPLFTGNVMRGITDKARVSREKLSYICDSTSAPVCIVLPFTSWGVYVSGLVIGYGVIADATMGMDVIVKSVPFQFYGIATVIFVGLIASGILPDFGPMKAAEKRAKETGQVYAEGSTPLLSEELNTIVPREGVKCNLLLHFAMPAIIIICITVGTYIFLGSAKTLEAFVVAVLYQGIMLVAFRMANLKELMDSAMIGIRSVMAATMILAAAYCINSISKTLGTANYVISITEAWMTPVTLLALTFAICAFIAFFTGTSWGTYAIMIPMCLPVALNLSNGELNNLVFATVAAVMGGGCFGDHCSPLSDTTILSSLGAGSDHIDHVRTQMPYALTTAAISLVGYIIVGFAIA